MVEVLKEKKVTIADIATRAGVTKSTVSMVFRNKPGISQETRQRIMEIARELKYTLFPVRHTRGKIHWGQLGLVIVSKDNPPPDKRFPMNYFNHMMNGSSAFAEKKGNSLIFSHMDWDQVAAGNLSAVLSRGHVDGFLFRAWISPEVEEMIRKIDVPVVLMDCDRYLDGYSSVQVDNIKAMDMVVEHLVRQGARRFAAITGDMGHLNAQERLAGVQMGLMRRGIPLPAEAVVTAPDFGVESGRYGVKKLLEVGVQFDALICQCDLMAYGAIEQLAMAEIRVPEDVRVTGFDNMEFSDKMAIPLTTVDTDSYQLGWLGSRLLLAQTSGEEERPLHLRSEVSLVVRKSA